MHFILDCKVLPVFHPLKQFCYKFKHLSLCSREDIGLKFCSLNPESATRVTFSLGFQYLLQSPQKKVAPSPSTSLLGNFFISEFMHFNSVHDLIIWKKLVHMPKTNPGVIYVVPTSLNLLRRYYFLLRLFFIAKTPISLQIFMQFVDVLPAPICQFWCHLFSSTCFSKPECICTSCILYDCICLLGITCL